jgi:hypothetical protein
VRDEHDPLFVFNDATVHEECFARDSRSPAVEAALAARNRNKVELT